MPIQALDLSAHSGSAALSRAATSATRLRVADVLRVSLALMVVGTLGRIPVLLVGNKDAPILLNDFLVFAVLAAGAVVVLRERRMVLDTPAAIALVFVSFAAVSTLLAIPRFELSGFQFLISIAYLVRWVFYFGIYLVVINCIRRDDVPSVLKTFESAVLIFAGFGIFQSIFLPGFAQIIYPDSALYLDWDPQGRRLVSTFLDPNFAGALIMMALLVSLSRLVFGVETSRWKLLVLFVALALTVSRSSVLGFAAGALVILLVRGLSRRLLRFAGVLLLIIAPLLPVFLSYAMEFNRFSLGGSAALRLISWMQALQVFADHPILGVGFNTYGFVQAQYFGAGIYRASFGVDGGLLFIAVMTGIVGLVLYSSMVLSVAARCRRVWKNILATPEDRGLCLGVVAVTVALLVHSVFLNSLLFPFLMQPLWVLWGLAFLVRHLQDETSPPVPDADGARSQPSISLLAGRT